MDKRGQEKATLVLNGSVVSATYPPGSGWDPESGTFDGKTIDIFGLRGTYRDGSITWIKNGSVWTRRPPAAESAGQSGGSKAWGDNGRAVGANAEQHTSANGATQASWQAPSASQPAELAAAAATCPPNGARAVEMPADPEESRELKVRRTCESQGLGSERICFWASQFSYAWQSFRRAGGIRFDECLPSRKRSTKIPGVSPDPKWFFNSVRLGLGLRCVVRFSGLDFRKG